MLVWAVLDRATAGWGGVTVTPADARLLARLRAQLEPATLPTPVRADGEPDVDAAVSAVSGLNEPINPR